MKEHLIDEPYAIPPPSARLVAIAAKWAKLACTVEIFNLFSDLSRCSEGDVKILINDAALAIAKQAAIDNLLGEDAELSHEARVIIEWSDNMADLRRSGAAPTCSPPKGVMTIDQWVKENEF